MQTRSEPVAVLISDIHFNLTTLPLASKALESALSKAKDLQVPLIIAGDLHDTKAIIRAEIANELIRILNQDDVQVVILVGNHDLINEKSYEHGLEYLAPYTTIVARCARSFGPLDLIPYQNTPEAFLAELSKCRKLVICHQGFKGASMGDYVLDKTSVDPELVKDFTVISGHYHRHQTIGTVTYIGSPFTMSFGEANDGAKGYLILNSDGTYTREILNFRKHIKIECDYKDLDASLFKNAGPADLIRVKVSGPRSELAKIKKTELWGGGNFKLDLIPQDAEKGLESVEQTPKLVAPSVYDILDSIINAETETEAQKDYLRRVYREILNG